MKYLFIILSIIFVLGSCQKEINEPEAKSFDNIHFPLVVGNWISYQIQDITMDIQSGVNDTLNYQIKESIESLIEDKEDYKTYRLERYFRYLETDAWEILNVWEIRQYATRIHKIEENIEYIRLLTPAVNKSNWDGNTYNIEENEPCQIVKIENSLVGIKDIETVFVSHYDYSSLIDKHFSEEQYAKGIGLTSKTIIDVELNIDPNLDWDEKITKGHIYYQNYIQHND